MWTEKVPEVAADVAKHYDSTVGLIAWFTDELDACLDHPLVRRSKVVDS